MREARMRKMRKYFQESFSNPLEAPCVIIKLAKKLVRRMNPLPRERVGVLKTVRRRVGGE